MINLIIFWILYYLFHSILAIPSVKEAAENKLGIPPQTYRLVYILLSTGALIVLLVFMATLHHHYLWGSMFAKFFGLMLATYGIFITREAFRNYHTKAFLGLSDPNEESKELITEGLQKHIRHPLYAGTILIILGFFFYMPTVENLAVVIISLIYIFAGIKIEEKKLEKTFGSKYKEYKRKVPMLIPRLKK